LAGGGGCEADKVAEAPTSFGSSWGFGPLLLTVDITVQLIPESLFTGYY
jgi:hypothetical protein